MCPWWNIIFFTSHQLQSQVNCTWPHSAFFSNDLHCRSDRPLYKVVASESGSYLIWLLQWECYRLFAWLWSHDQLSVNMKTVHFWKILLAQAERAWEFSVIYLKSSYCNSCQKLEAFVWEKQLLPPSHVCIVFQTNPNVNSKIFKLLLNLSLTI